MRETSPLRRTFKTLPQHIARGSALFIGTFLLLSILLWIRSGEAYDVSIWILDLRMLQSSPRFITIAALSIALLSFAIAPRKKHPRTLALVASAAIALIALGDSLTFVTLLTNSDIDTPIWFPLSGMTALLSLLMIIGIRQTPQTGPPSRTTRTHNALITLTIGGALGIAAPVLQMICFGKTDYRQTADIAVVFGSRVYADGTLSDALADRVRTACELYERGSVQTLFMSGGPGDGDITEAAAMRQFAIEHGVPAEYIIIDNHGFNTRCTVQNAASSNMTTNETKLLMVSHAYHLPRIKLACNRAGLNARTVPAQETYVLTALPWFMAREVAAQWAYVLSTNAP